MSKSFHLFEFTYAKLYNAGGDLSKPWYVYYSIRNAEGNLILKKKKAGINRGKTVKERTRLAAMVEAQINNLLRKGWRDDIHSDPSNILTLKEILEQVRDLKKTSLKWRTWQSHKYCLDKFFAWLDKNKYQQLFPKQFTAAMANAFTDHLLSKGLAAKTFNYNKDTVRHFFALLEDREIIEKNPFKRIKSLPVTPRRHIAFSAEQMKKIDEHMQKNCYQLYVFSRFVLYCFIRPIEVLRIDVSQVDTINWRIMIYADQAKSTAARVVEIPAPLRPIIKKMKLKSYPPNFKLFGRGMFPGEKAITRNAVTENFRRWVKVPLKLPVDYTLYGMKHTGNARAFDLGISIESIRRQNGHATEAQTRTYMRSLSKDYNSEFAKKMK